MPSLSVIADNSKELMQLLHEKKELRRELVSFFSEIKLIWKGLPANLDSNAKENLLRDIVDKGVAEISYGLEILDRQISSIIEGHGASLQALEKQLKDSVELSSALLWDKDMIISGLNIKVENLECSVKEKEAKLNDSLSNYNILNKQNKEANNKIAELGKKLNELIEGMRKDLDNALSENANMINRIITIYNNGINCISEWSVFSNNQEKVINLLNELKEMIPEDKK